jgi:arylsulfatase A-like enzyme
MTSKKSFLTVVRIIFVVFSLQFLKDAFYLWDGFSYYIPFKDFLPDLSLAFILWTLIATIIAFTLWLAAYCFYKVMLKSPLSVRLAHITLFLVFIVFPLFMKRAFYRHISLSDIAGVNHSAVLMIGGVSAVFVLWFGRKYCEKILYELDNRITPLVWLFALLFLIAIPSSVLKKSVPNNSLQLAPTEQMIFSSSKPPNIILVTMDALTSLDMQVYGYHRPTTPFISEWARDAYVFNRVYAPSNWTTPAIMSLLTGQRVWTHRVWYHASLHPVNNYKGNLPRILGDHGYAIYGYVQNDKAHPDILGLRDAFLENDKASTFWLPQGLWIDKLSKFLSSRPIVYLWTIKSNPIIKKIESFAPGYVYDETLRPAEKVYELFLEQISEIQNNEKMQKPFFAWLHVFPPHDPYLPPEQYMGAFGDSKKFNTNEKMYSRFTFHKEYKLERQENVDILRKRYDEFLLYSDQQFKQFILRLDEIINMSNTIIILSSDHGESFSQGWLGHGGPHLFESLVRIPLVIKMPRLNEKVTVDMPVSQIDIAPTILEIAGIPVPSWMEGRSLLPLTNGDALEAVPVFSMQFRENRSLGHPITKGTIALWDGDYKLVYHLDEKSSQLYNLRSDGGETVDLSKNRPDLVLKYNELILEYLAEANKKITHSSHRGRS